MTPISIDQRKSYQVGYKGTKKANISFDTFARMGSGPIVRKWDKGVRLQFT